MLEPTALERLPLFPLPGLVFFPPTLLPLHMFEPRYRELAAWCIANRSPLAVVRIQAGSESEQLGNPPVAPVAGVGKLIFHEKLPDGRYNILLRGLARVRLLEELDRDLGFRMARAEIVSDEFPADRVGLERKTRSLKKYVTNLIPQWPQAARLLGRILERHAAPAELADYLASVLFQDPGERQKLLECVRVEERLERVQERVIHLLADTVSPGHTIQ